jgi:hypothetical protein
MRSGRDVRKSRPDKIHLLKRITLDEREIQTLFSVLGLPKHLRRRTVGILT